MICYAMKFEQKHLLRRVPPFRSKMIRGQSLPLTCNVNIHVFNVNIQNRFKIVLYCAVKFFFGNPYLNPDGFCLLRQGTLQLSIVIHVACANEGYVLFCFFKL